MNNPIILIAGGTGVGTSTFSFELAKVLDVGTIVSTDMVRETIRSTMNPNINPVLSNSTYDAGKTIHYDSKSEEVQKSEVIRAFKNQCAAVSVGVEAIIKRATKENIPIIIEGIHLIPGKIRDFPLYDSLTDYLTQYLIYISDSEIHRERFVNRQMVAPARNIDKYLSNFREIRWIQDYLLKRASRFEDVCIIDNIANQSSAKERMLKSYYSKIQR